MGKPQSKRDQQCILMSEKLSRALQEQINKKKCGFNLANYNVHSSVSEFSICCFDSSTKAAEIPLKVELPPKMPVGTTSNSHNIFLNSQVLNCCDGISKSTNTTGDTNDDNCNKIEPFECELQVDTSSEKKQDWSFTLYDFDGRGKITKEELGNLFQALYDAVGSSIRLPLNGTKKLKLRLSIGHDNSHLDTNLKDQSPPLVKKKAKLKNSNGLTEWKEMSLQANAGGGPGVGMLDSKECTKLNNLDASPRAKASAVSKMENQLTPGATPGIGHRLMLSCKEQQKLTEMVHENMVRNHVRQQTGRKHHHSGHRHHHHHREARRHRGTRRQGDENRKPHDKERTYYLDLGGIDRSPSQNAVNLPYSASVPTATSTTTATVTTTSVMTFAQPPVINIVPSSSPPPPPPPPPPPTASGSTAYCNEIGMAADDDDDEDDGGGDGNTVIKPEAGRRKYDNPWRETWLEEPATGHSGLVATSDQQDHNHRHHHPHHHHHHHHHRRRHHPHRNSGDNGHEKCKHCNEKCVPVDTDAVKSSVNEMPESEFTNKNDKKEIINRRHKYHNTNINNNYNFNDNSNEINSVKDISYNRNTNHESVVASTGEITKQDNPPSTHKCPNSDANLKPNQDCVCRRCQKMSCRVHVSSWQVKSENVHDPRQRNATASADGQEKHAGINMLTSAATIMTTTTTTAEGSQYEKKTHDRSSKRAGEERHKKQGQGHHHAHISRTVSQEQNGQSGPAVAVSSSSVSASVSKMTAAPGGTQGAIAERKSLRTHHKTDASLQQTSNRHRAHCPITIVPEKTAGVLPSALLPPTVSPPPPAPTPTTAVSTATTTINNTQQQQQQPPQPHHHHRRRNQTVRNLEFNEAMQQVADWINREHNTQHKRGAQPSHQGSVNTEHFVHVQRHEHHHVHEYHHHHHYHHYYQT